MADIREYTPRFLAEHENGVVLRVSCTLAEVGGVLESLPAPALARAGSGVCYGYFADAGDLRHPSIGQSVIEFAPQRIRESRSCGRSRVTILR